MLNKRTEDLLHPRGQRANPIAEIVTKRGAMTRIVQKRGQPLYDALLLCLKQILKPVECLHDPHGGPAGPIETAGRHRLELDLLARGQGPPW